MLAGLYTDTFGMTGGRRCLGPDHRLAQFAARVITAYIKPEPVQLVVIFMQVGGWFLPHADAPGCHGIKIAVAEPWLLIVVIGEDVKTPMVRPEGV